MMSPSFSKKSSGFLLLTKHTGLRKAFNSSKIQAHSYFQTRSTPASQALWVPLKSFCCILFMFISLLVFSILSPLCRIDLLCPQMHMAPTYSLTNQGTQSSQLRVITPAELSWHLNGVPVPGTCISHPRIDNGEILERRHWEQATSSSLLHIKSGHSCRMSEWINFISLWKHCTTILILLGFWDRNSYGLWSRLKHELKFRI